MLFDICFVVMLLAYTADADITGQNPPAGSCLCMNANGVNIRSTACGAVIGSANNGNCYTSHGDRVTCELSGTTYDFFHFDFNGQNGWAAGNFMDVDNTKCGSSENSYTCSLNRRYDRVHETTSATIYDCKHTDCSNTCQGGQCVALVTCSCTRNGNYAPGTSCWRPGKKVAMGDGTCDSSIPANTAIATFSGSSYYAGHAGIFIQCSSASTAQVYDQWCCRNIDYSYYGSGNSLYADFYVIENQGACSDRSSWTCRWETAGSNCCPTSVSGCLNHKYWWTPFMAEE